VPKIEEKMQIQGQINFIWGLIGENLSLGA
jgi:hypothetical protein